MGTTLLNCDGDTGLKALQSLQLFTGPHSHTLLQRVLSDIPADVNRIPQDSLAEPLTLCPHLETVAQCSIPNMLGLGLFWCTNKRAGAWLLLDDYKPCFGGNLTRPKNTQYQSNNTPCKALSPVLPRHEYLLIQTMWSDEGVRPCVCVRV